MAGEVRDFVADDLLITINGQLMTGFGPNDKVTIESANDAGIKATEGIDHEISRSRNKSKRAKITIPLAQTSAWNDKMCGLYETDLANGAPFSISIQDLNGTTNVTATRAWIQGYPSAGFGSGADQTRSWVVETGLCASYVIGGNTAI